jgi:hypothetical protein
MWRFGDRPYKVAMASDHTGAAGPIRVHPWTFFSKIRVIRVIRGKKQRALGLCGSPQQPPVSPQPAPELTIGNWLLRT